MYDMVDDPVSRSSISSRGQLSAVVGALLHGEPSGPLETLSSLIRTRDRAILFPFHVFVLLHNSYTLRCRFQRCPP